MHKQHLALELNCKQQTARVTGLAHWPIYLGHNPVFDLLYNPTHALFTL